jgi:hypothetical protein
MGEVSIYAAWNITKVLGTKPDMNDISTRGKYAIILYAKSAPKDGWKVKKDDKSNILRHKIYVQGKKCYNAYVGRCLNKNKKNPKS